MILKQIPEDFVVRELPGYSSGNGTFSIFRLKKKNYTTEKAIQTICKKLRIDRKSVGYAGIKDRQAVTQQYISIYKIKKEKAEGLKLNDIELRFVALSRKPISIGNLKGNAFEIVVRNLEKNTKINPDVKIKNFFDEQRFSNNNAEVGRAIVKKDFKKAVEFILETDGDYEKDVKNFLKEHKNDFVGALRRIPFRILLLFVHAYQSRMFNETIEQIDNEKNIEVPMVGFGFECKDKKIAKIVEAIIKKEGVSERDFIVQSIPGLSCEGDVRELYIIPKNLEIGELEKDELNKDKYKVKISFSLPKGAYATNVIKQIVSQ
ncbi:MAG: tRNA pseudouridine(13) synthase TruD [archaeon]